MNGYNLRNLILFLAFQILIFSFYFISISYTFPIYLTTLSYYLYIALAWLELFIFLLFTNLKSRILDNFKNIKGLVILISVFTIWVYVIEVSLPGSNNIPYIFTTLVTLVCFQEFNFRLIAIETFARFVNLGVSTLISAIIYTMFFGLYLYVYLGGYPGFYPYLFILDTFSMGLIIGAVYALTRSVYFTSSITLSLYIIALFPYTPAIISYMFVPV